MRNLIGPPDLRSMSHAQRLRYLADRCIRLYNAESHGGGNRDHRVWTVEFSGAGLEAYERRPFYRMQVECWTCTGSVDGKRACEQEAKRRAVEKLLNIA